MTSIETEVERTLLRHAWGFDDGDWDLLEQAYTPDATVEAAPGEGMTSNPVNPAFCDGRDQVLKALRDSRAEFTARGERPWHFITNILVEEHDETTAKVRSFNLFLQTTHEGAAVFGMSRYYDTMVKQDGKWRIKARINRLACVGTGQRI